MSDNDAIVMEVCGHVAILSLNRPAALNAIDVKFIEALSTHLDVIETSDQIRAFIIRGNGRAFCAGGDISVFREGKSNAEVAAGTIDLFHPVVERMSRCSRPSVAAVHGFAAGAGIGLMLSCDFAVAAADTRFTIAYSKLGASMDGGTSWVLAKAVGQRKAIELAVLSEMFTADQAMKYGMLYEVVDPEALDMHALQLAERLASGPIGAYHEIKSLIRKADKNDLASQLDVERASFTSLVQGSEFHEGISAFLDKRSPDFTKV